MTIVSMKTILADAAKQKKAVGCFNAINLEMTRGVLQAAETCNAPVILCHAEIHFKYTPLEKIAPILRREAQNASVPVALLLDHGKSFDALVRAMNQGFNAVMYDGSDLPYEENVKNTKEIVRIAKALGVSVEAELGHVVRPKSAGADGDEDDDTAGDPSFYTNPQQAKSFVEQTGVDALAIAFGTAHGLYAKKPQLDLGRLQSIRKVVDIPLVMHGGSGLSDEDFANCIKHGIVKVNYYTGMAKAGVERIRCALQQNRDIYLYHHLMMDAMDAFAEDVKKAFDVFEQTDA